MKQSHKEFMEMNADWLQDKFMDEHDKEFHNFCLDEYKKEIGKTTKFNLKKNE